MEHKHSLIAISNLIVAVRELSSIVRDLDPGRTGNYRYIQAALDEAKKQLDAAYVWEKR